MKDTFKMLTIVLHESDKELQCEIDRISSLSLQTEGKKTKKKKEKSEEEIQDEILKALGVNKDDLLKEKLKIILGGS